MPVEERIKKLRLPHRMISEIPEYAETWKIIIKGYAERGYPGISYLKTEFESGACLESLLFRDQKGMLLGIMDYFSSDGIPNEVKGNVNVVVHPDFQNKGIGSSLWVAGMKKWQIDLNQQLYTPLGHKLLLSHLKKKSL